MSRYESRLLMLQLMAEECDNAEERAQILGEVAALKEAMEPMLRRISEELGR